MKQFEKQAEEEVGERNDQHRSKVGKGGFEVEIEENTYA